MEKFLLVLGDLAMLATSGLVDLKEGGGKEDLEGALIGYDKALMQTFCLLDALTCLDSVRALGMK